MGTLDPMMGDERDGAMRHSRVLIVGGGAAGLTAAIAAARRGASVTLFEAGPRVGRKILASGNGRCNLTNLSISPSAYNDPDFVEPVLGTYSCEAILTFFAEMGVLTSADDQGRVYPTTNASGSVLDAMRLECEHLGVEVRCGFEAVRVSAEPGAAHVEVFSAGGEAVSGETVVVTTGGGGALLGDMGHEVVPGAPVLGPIRTETEPIRGLSGVRVRCAATLLVGTDGDSGGDAVATESGELLFRDYGVSGIMVFDLSRYLEPGCVISIDLFPDVALPELHAMLARRVAGLSWRTAETFFAGMLHDRVARAVMRAAGIGRDTLAEELPVAPLAALLKDFRLRVVGMGDAAQAQVTRGGAAVDGFDPGTIASRHVDGLFAAGEVLDIDGRSGGFNLHWAWASGIAAGEAAARAAEARGAAPGDGGSGGSG